MLENPTFDKGHEDEEENELLQKKLQVSQDPFETLVKNRILWLNSAVSDKSMGDIAARMLVLSEEDPEADIYLFINSPGGTIHSGLMLYDVMQMIPNDIVTVAVGHAASMGQFLLTVGTEGKRYITSHAEVLLHQPLGGYGGTASDIRGQAERILLLKKQLASITASRTGKTVEQVMEDGDRDRWFNAEEAVEYGFADRVVSTLAEIRNSEPAKKAAPRKRTTARKTTAKKSTPKNDTDKS